MKRQVTAVPPGLPQGVRYVVCTPTAVRARAPAKWRASPAKGTGRVQVPQGPARGSLGLLQKDALGLNRTPQSEGRSISR